MVMPAMLWAQSQKPFIWPIEDEVITGFREEYWDHDREIYRKHTGIDIKASPGTKVKASANGRVTYIGISPIGGLTVVLEHNEKIRTTYLNLLYVNVGRGEQVFQGQNIAVIGAQDDPSHTGTHLHFGVIYDGTYLNPEDLLGIDYASISRFIYLDYLRNDYRLLADYYIRYFPF